MECSEVLTSLLEHIRNFTVLACEVWPVPRVITPVLAMRILCTYMNVSHHYHIDAFIYTVPFGETHLFLPCSLSRYLFLFTRTVTSFHNPSWSPRCLVRLSRYFLQTIIIGITTMLLLFPHSNFILADQGSYHILPSLQEVAYGFVEKIIKALCPNFHKGSNYKIS